MMATMKRDDLSASREREPAAEPPAIYFAACGALCDLFWWARKSPPPAEAPDPRADGRAASDHNSARR
jgi:hypothetical protein